MEKDLLSGLLSDLADFTIEGISDANRVEVMGTIEEIMNSITSGSLAIDHIIPKEDATNEELQSAVIAFHEYAYRLCL